MADQKVAARRAAEKAARERLGGVLISAVGELGAAVAAQQSSVDDIAAAQQRGAELVAAARAEADRLMRAARKTAIDVDEAYGAAYDDALAAGWAEAALKDMGYPQPTRRRSRRDGTATQPAAPNTGTGPRTATDDGSGDDTAVTIDAAAAPAA